VLLQLIMKGLQTDPEELRRARLVVARVLQRAKDQVLLRLLDGRSHPQEDSVAVRLRRRSRRRAEDIHRQVWPTDGSLSRQDDRPLHDVAQFPNVARPVELLETVQHGGIEPGDAAGMLVVDLAEQGFGEDRDVVLAIAQGWQMDLKHVEAIVKVLPQLA